MIVFKDKKDIQYAPETFSQNVPYRLMGAYGSLDFVDRNIRVLSVQFSKVGKKTYDAFPNLEWIVARSHGIDNVNLEECEKRGIGIVNTNPYAESTARWIQQHLAGDWRIGGSGIHFGTVGFVGYGAIAKNVKVPNKLVFNSKNTKEDLLKLAVNANTLVITIPQTKETKGIIGEAVLSVFFGKIISVGRWDIIDNKALLKNIERITHAYIDTLGETNQQELLDTGKVTYSKHTAWSTGFSYDEKYFHNLESIIKKCLNNTVDNPTLPRKKRRTLWD